MIDRKTPHLLQIKGKMIVSIVHLIIIISLFGFSCINKSQPGSIAKTAVDSPIKPYRDNPRYWEYHGEPVLLLGGSKDDNLFQIDDLEAHLDEIKEVGANYVRNTMSSRDAGNEWPFLKLENGKYDLNQMNEKYWQKFENFLQMTHERGIFVQIEIWDRFDYSREPWQVNPFNPKNNINYNPGETPLDTIYPKHPAKDVQPFFHTISGMSKYAPGLDKIRKFQEKRVDKMLQYTLQYDHILYCMNNETSTPPQWGEYWINFINKKADEKGIEVFATDMFGHFFKPSTCESCKMLISNPDIYRFLDCSQVNSRNFDQNHWDTLQWIVKKREHYDIRPINMTKVYGGAQSSWGSGTNQDGVERFCRSIIGGAASARHHRPEAGNGLNEKAKASIRAIRNLESVIKSWEVSPAMDLLTEREPNEAYVTASIGEKYAVYFPAAGAVKLNLSAVQGKMNLTWISVQTGKLRNEESIIGGQWIGLIAPDDTGWIAAIVNE
jgi:hypothetical protein